MRKLLFILLLLPALAFSQGRTWGSLINTGDSVIQADLTDYSVYILSLDTSEASNARKNKVFGTWTMDSLFLNAAGDTIIWLFSDSIKVDKLLLGSDPGADRILFWDESSDSTDYLTVGSGLTISTTTLSLNATGDWTGTFDGQEGSYYLTINNLDQDKDSLHVDDLDVDTASITNLNLTATAGSFYQTGTFTPVVADAASGGNTATGSFSANWTKIGNTVTLAITLQNINTAGMVGGADLFIGNIPALIVGNSSYNQAGSLYADSMSFSGSLSVIVPGGGVDYFFIGETISGSGFDLITISDISSGVTDINITVTYLTN